jgi:signal transduction histidine kinase
VYGRFISVWREKEDALRQSRLKTLLLQNASHQVRTPLHQASSLAFSAGRHRKLTLFPSLQIIGYLQLALDDDLSPEVRRNLSNSHAASRSLVHVVNDLLELTQASAPGQDLFSQDPFDLPSTIEEAISMYRTEVEQRGLSLEVIENPSGTPSTLLGDRAKIKTIITNVVGNAVEHTKKGSILVEWGELPDQVSRRGSCLPPRDE